MSYLSFSGPGDVMGSWLTAAESAAPLGDSAAAMTPRRTRVRLVSRRKEARLERSLIELGRNEDKIPAALERPPDP